MNKPTVSFASTRTFNTVDTSVAENIHGRIEISLGVRKRCELVLASVLRLTKDGNGVSVSRVLKDLHARKYTSYTSSDISTAMRRLVQGEAVEKVSHGAFAPTDKAKQVWKLAIGKK